MSTAELTYELDDDGLTMRALGDPTALQLEEVQERVLELLTEDLQTTKQLWESLGDPKPSEEQVRRALTEAGRAGRCTRDPDIAADARGKTHRWRAGSALPISMSIGGSEPPLPDEPARQADEDPLEDPADYWGQRMDQDARP